MGACGSVSAHPTFDADHLSSVPRHSNRNAVYPSGPSKRQPQHGQHGQHRHQRVERERRSLRDDVNATRDDDESSHSDMNGPTSNTSNGHPKANRPSQIQVASPAYTRINGTDTHIPTSASAEAPRRSLTWLSVNKGAQVSSTVELGTTPTPALSRLSLVAPSQSSPSHAMGPTSHRRIPVGTIMTSAPSSSPVLTPVAYSSSTAVASAARRAFGILGPTDKSPVLTSKPAPSTKVDDLTPVSVTSPFDYCPPQHHNHHHHHHHHNQQQQQGSQQSQLPPHSSRQQQAPGPRPTPQVRSSNEPSPVMTQNQQQDHPSLAMHVSFGSSVSQAPVQRTLTAESEMPLTDRPIYDLFARKICEFTDRSCATASSARHGQDPSGLRPAQSLDVFYVDGTPQVYIPPLRLPPPARSVGEMRTLERSPGLSPALLSPSDILNARALLASSQQPVMTEGGLQEAVRTGSADPAGREAAIKSRPSIERGCSFPTKLDSDSNVLAPTPRVVHPTNPTPKEALIYQSSGLRGSTSALTRRRLSAPSAVLELEKVSSRRLLVALSSASGNTHNPTLARVIQSVLDSPRFTPVAPPQPDVPLPVTDPVDRAALDPQLFKRHLSVRPVAEGLEQPENTSPAGLNRAASLGSGPRRFSRKEVKMLL